MIKDRAGKNAASPLIWTFTTYFAEGLPYVLIRTLSTFFFRAGGASLEATGLTSLYGLPWIVKFVWAPYLDSFGTKRRWLLITQGGLAILFAAIALLADLPGVLPIISLLFFVAGFFAASNDTAIDGYYLEALNAEEQARFVGYRVMAYRIAMMFGSGAIVTIGARAGWAWAFGLSALVLALLCLFHCALLPRCEQAGKSIRQLMGRIFTLPFILTTATVIIFLAWLVSQYGKSPFPPGDFSFPHLVGTLLFFSLLLLIVLRKKILTVIRNHPDAVFPRAFLSFIDREKIAVVIFFIICVRMGEFMLSAMAGPFFIDIGLEKHYGWITGVVGLPCSIIGAMAGGWLIARKTLKRMIMPFLLAQNVTNLAYMMLAFHLQHADRIAGGSVAVTTSNILLASSVAAFDHLAGGLGTAVLMTFLMGLCKGDFKAAHFAIGTGLMSVAGLYAGSFSGFLVEWLGYAVFFGISFVFSLPAMGLIPFLSWQEVKD